LAIAVDAVFAKGDNQPKLKAADAHERHLFVWMTDASAAAVFGLPDEPPPCPIDPQGVIHVVWAYSSRASWAVFRATPGGRWERFNDVTGDPAPYPPRDPWHGPDIDSPMF
jgi:hypothetical protein